MEQGKWPLLKIKQEEKKHLHICEIMRSYYKNNLKNENKCTTKLWIKNNAYYYILKTVLALLTVYVYFIFSYVTIYYCTT